MTHQDIDAAVQQLTEEIQARDTTIESLQTELHNMRAEYQEYHDHIQSAFEIVSKQAASGSQITKTAGRIFSEGTSPAQIQESSRGVDKEPKSHQTNMASA